MKDIKKMKVDGHNNLIRDVISNGIVNTDKSGYDSYVELRKLKNKEYKRIDQIESDLSSLKNDIADIKNLLLNINKNI